ncbi:MAG TPA: lipoyl(octanoyl) transferase LipB [Dehalococcoidia bacterium]|nr:lipoyl(octanoyl) transferase LipB [Dehalococcoidia bacterium]
MSSLEAVWLGRVDYQTAWDLQGRLVVARSAGQIPDQLLLLDHPHTFTIGRSGTRDHLLIGPERLADLGASVFEVDRGGDITYHGPGQLVGYPIVDLTQRGRDAHAYLRAIEQSLIDLLAGWGIAADRSPGYTGVWVGYEKVAAIGVRISRWVTSHGFALNLDPDLSYFEAIVPCGIRDRGVTSVRQLAGGAPPLPEAARLAAEHLSRVWDADLRWADPTDWLDARGLTCLPGVLSR